MFLSFIAFITMNLNSSNNSLTTSTATLNHLLAKIEGTCNALISALEITTESASSYGGGMIRHFESEYVDQIIRNLLQLRAYSLRLRQETQKGLLQSREDLQILVEGMYDFSDKLEQLLLENGFIRHNFQYALDELKNNIQSILAEVTIGIR